MEAAFPASKAMTFQERGLRECRKRSEGEGQKSAVKAVESNQAKKNPCSESTSGSGEW
jgi:hypothetical protein